VAGDLLVTLGSTAELAAAVQAFGATVSFGDLLLVVAGSALSGVVPLPGGAGRRAAHGSGTVARRASYARESRIR